MDDLLLLIHGLLKVALVISVMVLVATAPPTASAAVGDQGRPGLRSTTAVGAWANHRGDGDAAMDGAFVDSDIFDAGRWPTDQAAEVRHIRPVFALSAAPSFNGIKDLERPRVASV